jgi:hypothetical protein
MKMRFCLLILLVLGFSTSGISLAASIVFGLPDESGGQIISVEQSDNPNQLSFAVCGDKKVSTEFLKTLDEGRQVFKIKGQPVTKDSSCLLVGADFLSGRKILKVKHTERSYSSDGVINLPSSDSKLIKTASEIKKRPIAHSWRLASLPNGSVDLIEFERRGKNLLASLVLNRDGRLTFDDYPAEDNEFSAWRVDDGGVFSPEGFFVLMAFEKAGQIELGLLWAGTETNNYQLLQESGPNFKEIINNGLYVGGGG